MKNSENFDAKELLEIPLNNVNKTPLRKNLLIWQSGLKHNSALIFLVLFSSKEKST